MNIDHLREFSFLADTLNFGITARHFFLSQSVLSKHIAAMEDELHTKLLERNSHSVSLTKQGEAFKKDADAIVKRYDNAIMRINGIEEGYVSLLDIYYLRGAARPFIDKFLENLRKRAPKTQINLRCVEFCELGPVLETQNPDVVFAMDFFPEAHELYQVEPIYRDCFNIVARHDNPIHKEIVNGSLNVSSLKGKKLILPERNAYGNMANFIEGLLPFQIEVQPYFYSDIDTAITRLHLDDCIGFSSGHNISVYGNDVDFIPLADADSSYNVSAFISKEKDRPEIEVCKLVIDGLAKYMKSKKPFTTITK